MEYKIKGTITEISGIKTWDSGFYKRDIRLDCSDGKYPNPLVFQLKKEKCELAESLSVGDLVEVSFFLNGREYDSKFYMDLVAWKIEKEATTQIEPQPPF